MLVQFDASLDDCIEAAMKAISRSPTFSPYRWMDNLIGTVVFGFINAVVVYWYLVACGAQQSLYVTAGITGAVLATPYPLVRLLIIRQRLRRYYLEILGSDAPFGVQVETSPEGISVKQKTGQSSYHWSQIESILETANSIDFHTRHGGLVVVTKRAFESVDAIKKYKQEAEAFLARARMVPPS